MEDLQITETRGYKVVEISLSARATIPPRVLMREVAGEAVVLNLNNEQYYGLDQTGTRFWVKLTTSASLQDAIDALLEEYQVDRATVERDMCELVGKLVEHGLLELHDG
jgi:hypothetical protein